MTKIQTLKINGEVVYPRTIKQAIVDLQGTPTIITNDGSDGDAVAIRLTDSQTYKRVFRIDVAGTYTGGDVIQRIGSLIIECFDEDNNICHGYYYGDTLADILSEVAIYQDDTDPDTFYLMMTHDSSLDSVTFAITPIDGGEVDAFITNAGDDHTKIEDATITQVGGSSEVFVAEYGVTTASEIESAISSGKIVVCFYNSACYTFGRLETNYIYLSTTRQERYYNIAIHRTNNTWQTLSATFELSGNKVSSLSDNETNTTKYLNCKGVADALGKIGVISQTQTWSGTGNNPRTYVMSNPVTGLIPQANIDLFESAGATFNSTTGYFELNGLTDISYNEMSAIYAQNVPNPWSGLQGMFSYTNIRTNIPPKNNIATVTAFSGLRLAYGAGQIERLALKTNAYKVQLNNLQLAFFRLFYLSDIYDEIDVTNATNFAQAFELCYSLKEIRLYKLKASLTFAACSALSKDSLLYMINNSQTTAFTITLHASVYAKCQSGGEWYSDISTALAAHTNVSLASA